MLDGRNVQQFEVSRLRKSIAYVAQKPVVFYGTIRQHLSLCTPLISDNEIWVALESVGLSEEVKNMPNTLDSHTKDYIEIFSISFLQRLNIAAALLKRSKILLIDESTDALDQESMQKLKITLQQLKNKITIILVSQSPSILRMMDLVICVEQGKIVTGGPADTIVNQVLKGLDDDRQ